MIACASAQNLYQPLREIRAPLELYASSESALVDRLICHCRFKRA